MAAENGSHVNIDSPKFHVFEGIVDTIYPYDIEGQENIKTVRSMQEKVIGETGIPMPSLDVWNHEGTADPAIAGHFTATQFGDLATEIVLPVSHHYVATNAYLLYKLGVQHARQEGYVMPEIDQSYRGRDVYMTCAEDRQFQSGQGKRSGIFLRMLGPELAKGALYSIAPEGHRSLTLNPPEAGAGAIVSAMAKLIEKKEIEGGIIIPRGIFPSGKRNIVGREILTVKVGEPLSPAQVIERAQALAEEYDLPLTSSLYAHVLMLAVRDLLPPEMHGVYNAENDREFMRKIYGDQIKLVTERTTVNGKEKKIVKLRDFTLPFDPGFYIPPISLFGPPKY